MVPFVFAGQACALGGSCVATTLSAPVWAGVAIVGGAVAGAVFLGSKLIDAKSSTDSSAVKKSG